MLAVGIRNKRTQNRKNFGPCCTERRSGNIPRPSVEQAGVGLGVNLGRFGGVRSIYIGNGKILGDFGIWALESSDLLLIYMDFCPIDALEGARITTRYDTPTGIDL